MFSTPGIMKQGQPFDYFINSLKSPKTKSDYTRFLMEFAKYENVRSLDDLLIIHNSDTKLLKQDLIRFLNYLKNDKKVGSNYRKGALSAIKHFFEMNDITLPWMQISKFLGESDAVNENREYTYEEISKLLAVADLKYKAMILLLASTGIRVGAIHSLKYGDLIKVADYDIFKIVVYRRTRDEYYTFTTPETYSSLVEYLSYRERSGEVLTPESALFRHDFDPNDSSQVKDCKPLSHDAIKSKLRTLLIKSGVATYQPLPKQNNVFIGRGKRRNEVAAAHGLRKFAITQMGRSKMDSEIREMLVGHKLGVRGVYLKYSEEDRLNEYFKAVDHLTISQENTLKRHNEELRVRSETNEYIINHRLQEKELEVKSLQEKYEQDMKDMREEMNQQFSQIMSMIQQNPRLSQVKPEALTEKSVQK